MKIGLVPINIGYDADTMIKVAMGKGDPVDNLQKPRDDLLSRL